MTKVGAFALFMLITSRLVYCLVLPSNGLDGDSSSDHRTRQFIRDPHRAQLEKSQEESVMRNLGRDKTLTVEELTLAFNFNKNHSTSYTSPRQTENGRRLHQQDGDKIELEKLVSLVEEEKLESETLLPRRSNFPCPQSEDIIPCVCTYDVDYNIFLNCTEVESEQQLASVFQQEFPVKDLYQFLMTKNNAIKILGNILNGVTFQQVLLYPGPFVLEAVSEYFLLDSLDVLTLLHIHRSYLNSDLFPFNTFNFAKNLHIYYIDGTNFTWIPPVRGPLITQLSFDVAYIRTVEPGTFDGVPKVQILELQSNAIEGLRTGTFPIHEVPTTLMLYNNKIRTLEPGTFYFADSNSSASNADINIALYTNQIQSLYAGTFFFRDGHMTVDVHSNQISSIEPGTFVMPSVTVLLSIELSLNNNQLTTFDEDVFGNLMPFTTLLHLYGNPFQCGCDIAWLVLTPEFMAKVDAEASCDDGTRLHDLDPDLYEAIC